MFPRSAVSIFCSMFNELECMSDKTWAYSFPDAIIWSFFIEVYKLWTPALALCFSLILFMPNMTALSALLLCWYVYVLNFRTWALSCICDIKPM